MSYMKWLAHLDPADLEEMKELYKNAIEIKDKEIEFQGTIYETDYIKSVISFMDDFAWRHDPETYKEPDDLIY